MQKIILFLFMSGCFLQATCQWYDPEKVDHKANTIYSLAINKAQNEDYATAIKMINEALKIEPKFVDAYLSLAGIDADMKNYSGSVIPILKKHFLLIRFIPIIIFFPTPFRLQAVAVLTMH